MARRHPRLAALAAAIAAVVIALILAAVLSGGDDKPNARTTTQPAQTQDPHTADRAAIQRTMIAYHEALARNAPDDPCDYLTPSLRERISVIATLPAPASASCAIKARAADSAKALGPGLATLANPDAIDIEFGPFPESERKDIDAEVHWRASGRPYALLVRERSRWLIDAVGS